MRYVTLEYYNRFREENGLPAAEAGDGKYLDLAETRIDEVTLHRIRGMGFENFTEFQKEKIREAVCRQAEYISENGFESDDIQSYSVLSISVSTSGVKSEAQRCNMSPVALALLRETGLMFRGC